MIQQREKSAHLNPFHEGGFTLVELLIVVSIACIITPIYFLPLSHTSDEQKMRLFAEEIRDTISEAQMDAVLTSLPVRIAFNSQNDYYQIIKPNRVVTRKMDPRIVMYSNVNTQTIRISPVGKFLQPGTYTFFMGSIKYQLILQLGQGRFRIERAAW